MWRRLRCCRLEWCWVNILADGSPDPLERFLEYTRSGHMHTGEPHRGPEVGKRREV
jgi:hypothetical protein